MRKRRLRKWAKWTCTLAAGAAVALAVFSGFYSFASVTTPVSGGGGRCVGVGCGLIGIYRFYHSNVPYEEPITEWWMQRSSHWEWGISGGGSPYGVGWPWRGGILCTRDTYGWALGVSVLYPVALTLIPAALLWYADRRRLGPGLCKRCGYDRAGLAVGVKCPECGTVPAK